MSNLPLIGTIAAVGGAVGVGGLALEVSKSKSQSLTKSKESSSLKVSKRCEIFHIGSTPDLTVKKMEESTLRSRANGGSFGSGVDADCKTREKIYVAHRDGRWVYDRNEQGKAGRVID